MREALRAVAARMPVAVVTGRQLTTIQALLALPTLTVAASHGFQLWAPGLGLLAEPEVGLGLLESAATELEAAARQLPGVEIERKPFSIAVHHRAAPAEADTAIHERVAAVVGESGGALRMTPGRRVWEVQPDIDRDKGWAVRRVLQGLDPEIFAISLGDDVTDEDAFETVADRGVGILVRSTERPDVPTHATLALDGVPEVEQFLHALARL